MVCIISSVLIISIHAPTNGATSCDILSQAVLSFQSTLRRTERRTSRSSTFEIKYFNPRSDERSDVVNRAWLFVIPISIHAPTNGATPVIVAGTYVFKFQSTLRRTERPSPHANGSSSIIFQYTLRRTERLF